MSIPDTEPGMHKLLLIDDSLTFLRATVQFLQRQPHLVVVGTARDGRDGLKMAQDLQPDIVLVDLLMPDLSGLDLIPMLRSALPLAGIIVLSLHTEDDFQRQAACAGAHAFVAKPRLITDLLPAIEQVSELIVKQK